MTNGAPYVVGSPTSTAAAMSIVDDLNRLERIVLDKLEAAGFDGCTDDELEVLTGMSHQTLSARRNGLVKMDMVLDSGRKRVNRSGRSAVVWVRSSLPGIPRQKAPSRPTLAEAQTAVKELRELYALSGTPPSSAVVKVMLWFKWTVARSAR